MGLNTNYLSTNRGIIKILQIVAGFFISYLLCGTWTGGQGCFNEGRLGYATSLNSIVVVLNIIWLILNFVDLQLYKLERIYSVIVCVLFLIAAVLSVWYVIDHHANSWTMITSVVLIIVEFCLFLWDVKGEAAN